jgi:hypothetical protein
MDKKRPAPSRLTPAGTADSPQRAGSGSQKAGPRGLNTAYTTGRNKAAGIDREPQRDAR